MTMLNQYEKLADPLLNTFVEKASTLFLPRVISIFKLGSLGTHGDFSLCSDVDVALMLDHLQEADRGKIQILGDEIKSSQLEYADRLSIFWSSYNLDDFNAGVGRFPALDRFDLLKCGVLVAGVDRRSELKEPSHQEMVLESAAFITSFMLAGNKLEQLTRRPQEICASGSRYFTKFVLFPIRLLFTLAHPGRIGSNQDSVMFFKRSHINMLPSNTINLINAAYALRSAPANEPVSIDVSLVKSVLPLLYLYCIERYYEAVLQFNQYDTAQQLAEEKKRLLCAMQL